MNKSITTAVIAAALTFGTVAVASAQGFDPNPANRYPAYAAPVASQPTYFASAPGAVGSVQSAPVALQRSSQSAPVALHRSNKQLHSAPVRLQYQPEFSGQTTTARGDVAPGGDAR